MSFLTNNDHELLNKSTPVEALRKSLKSKTIVSPNAKTPKLSDLIQANWVSSSFMNLDESDNEAK